ncbi:dysbindin [Bacillus rossius redtenbacheri]|uniref:dysbindin n=1 Tax=Bacillus rossius redtenbacheri TaxID=93214 RepID=UPI002FDD0ABD
MFESIRDKFQTVQEGITASFRGLSVRERQEEPPAGDPSVNYNAGAELLHHYQTEWSQLHQQAEENAKEAEIVDALIGRLHQGFEKQWKDVGRLSLCLAAVPQTLNSVQQLMEQLGTLQELFEDVESALVSLEDVIETQDLQEKQLEHRFQFALYKVKKLDELDSLRVAMAKEHSEKVIQHELKQQQVLKERQEIFEEAFIQDVEEFKTSGSVPSKVETKGAGAPPSLEEVVLDPDLAELDDFLGETVAGAPATHDAPAADDDTPARSPCDAHRV